MANLFDKDTPSKSMLDDVLRKVNAYGHEPTVFIELDKIVYVDGVRSKFEILDRIRRATLETVTNTVDVTSPKDSEPTEPAARLEEIKAAFKKYVKSYGLDTQAYYFLLAVCKHETGFGTLGQGKKSNGSYIVGYGCPSSCDPTYSGIDTQAKYACKRYAEAMKSRLSKIKSAGKLDASDVAYFHDGGDKGTSFTWSADGENWKNKVKSYYDSIRVDSSYKSLSPTEYKAEVNKDSTILTEKIVFPVAGHSLGKNAKISSKYGKRGSEFHKGIDIVGTSPGKIKGEKVVAAYDGIVDTSKWSDSFGEYIILYHGNEYYTVYGHLISGSRKVSGGDRVKAGQVIGEVGTTGRSSGYHLHFEITKNHRSRSNAKFIDPEPILKGDSATSIGKTSNASSGISTPSSRTFVKNIVYNQCFGSSMNLSSNWVNKSNIKHFTSTKSKKKYIGFSTNVKAGQTKDFGFKHNFTADGYYEYSYFCNLSDGDEVTVTYDGMVVYRYTKANNTKTTTDENLIYATANSVVLPTSMAHTLDFTIDNKSGKAEFGIACFKVVEVDNLTGSVSENLVARKRDVWLETGNFSYDTTYTLEKDIIEWQINSHFDSRSSTASFTLSNKDGLYSPAYTQSGIFPDNKKTSDMSYYEENQIRHVLSEETPVRIYAGYGNNYVRVFTGKIKGEIQEDSENKTITVNCVDMYDCLEEHIFDRKMNYPKTDEVPLTGDIPTVSGDLWVKSSIVHDIVREAGLTGWRVTQEDMQYPDVVIEETYYIDIDRGGKKAVVWDAKQQKFVSKSIKTVKDAEGYKNPYVQSASWDAGTRASDAIQELIGDIMYRAYCDRYGTFRLENIRNISGNYKWDFKDSENIESLTTAIDHSRVRNHLMIVGSCGGVDHFIDKDLLISTKGKFRTAQIESSWVDESYGSSARGIKEDIANRLFLDMKRQARTFSIAVKGNPVIEVLDGCYIYDANTSSAGYYIIKGNKLTGNANGMVNLLEITWENSPS